MTWVELQNEMVMFWCDFLRKSMTKNLDKDTAKSQIQIWLRLRRKAVNFLGANLTWLLTLKEMPAIMTKFRMEAYIQQQDAFESNSFENFVKAECDEGLEMLEGLAKEGKLEPAEFTVYRDRCSIAQLSPYF